MRWIVGTIKVIATLLLVAIIGVNVWGWLSLGTLEPDPAPYRDDTANKVVLVSGATGIVGDGLLKSAINDPDVQRVHVITRRSSPRIDAGVASGKVEMHILQDFTDYSALADILPSVNTVMWGLGTSSLLVDDATYTLIHVDFPLAFAEAWLAARTDAPMAFHFVTGAGTDPEGSAHWMREKGRTERTLAAMAEGTGLRTFSYRCGMVRPTAENSNAAHYLMEWLLIPGNQVITATALGESMLEVSARTQELPNGTLLDTADSVVYARAYRQR